MLSAVGHISCGRRPLYKPRSITSRDSVKQWSGHSCLHAPVIGGGSTTGSSSGSASALPPWLENALAPKTRAHSSIPVALRRDTAGGAENLLVNSPASAWKL